LIGNDMPNLLHNFRNVIITFNSFSIFSLHTNSSVSNNLKQNFVRNLRASILSLVLLLRLNEQQRGLKVKSEARNIKAKVEKMKKKAEAAANEVNIGQPHFQLITGRINCLTNHMLLLRRVMNCGTNFRYSPTLDPALPSHSYGPSSNISYK
jgi:hypothetical protein